MKSLSYKSVFAKSLIYIVSILAVPVEIVHAMGGGGGAAAPQGPKDILMSFAPLVFIFVIFYFLLIRPQSQKAKQHKEVLANLKKGDKVMTNGGIFGMIDDVDGDVMTLKIGVGSDVKIKVDRNFIAGLRVKEETK